MVKQRFADEDIDNLLELVDTNKDGKVGFRATWAGLTWSHTQYY